MPLTTSCPAENTKLRQHHAPLSGTALHCTALHCCTRTYQVPIRIFLPATVPLLRGADTSGRVFQPPLRANPLLHRELLRLALSTSRHSPLASIGCRRRRHRHRR
ncbi:unnamed protein product, partial [Laminaria digitata]